MNIKVSDSKKRHGNCVPCVIINVKTGTIFYRGSLSEGAKKLKTSGAQMYYYHKSGKLFKSKYKIKKLGFSNELNLS